MTKQGEITGRLGEWSGRPKKHGKSDNRETGTIHWENENRETGRTVREIG